jgi:hypothetical protein
MHNRIFGGEEIRFLAINDHAIHRTDANCIGRGFTAHAFTNRLGVVPLSRASRKKINQQRTY